jgi:hypothetical protein
MYFDRAHLLAKAGFFPVKSLDKSRLPVIAQSFHSATTSRLDINVVEAIRQTEVIVGLSWSYRMCFCGVISF